MDPAEHADVSCSSSYALAMSPYIYLMTHLIHRIVISHSLLHLGAYPALRMYHGRPRGRLCKRCPARWLGKERPTSQLFIPLPMPHTPYTWPPHPPHYLIVVLSPFLCT